MRASFSELAEREFREAAAWYERERQGLGRAFVDEVERTTTRILDLPNTGAVVLGTIRRLLCHRFPYALLYEVKGEEVRILAVMNLRRRPGYWVGRT